MDVPNLSGSDGDGDEDGGAAGADPAETADDGAVATVAQDDVIGTFKTRRNGTYRIGYAYTASTEAQTETITPQSAQVVEVAIAKDDNHRHRR